MSDKRAYIEGKGLVFFELNEKHRILVMRRHEFALCVPSPKLRVNIPNMENIRHLQTTAVETRDQIRQALPLDTYLRCQDVVAHRQRRGDDQKVRGVQ